MNTHLATTSRRGFLNHAGALGLGSAFLPLTTGVARAAAPKDVDLPKIPGLIFEKFEAGGISHYSYFIGDPISGTALVVDPKRDVDDYVALAEKHRRPRPQAL